VKSVGEVVVSVRPVCVFANGPDGEIEVLRWRQAARAVMVLLSLPGLPAGQIAVLLECHSATVRRRIGIRARLLRARNCVYNPTCNGR
jgi:hypothetical protein